MTIIKVALLFFIFFNEKKLRRIRLIFDMEKWLWKSELCCFWPSILKGPKGQKYFYGRFRSFLANLLTTKLSCLLKNNFGHTNLTIQSVWNTWPHGVEDMSLFGINDSKQVVHAIFMIDFFFWIWTVLFFVPRTFFFSI